MSIDTKDLCPNISMLRNKMIPVLNSVLLAKEIDYVTFKKNTESKPLPLYIMENTIKRDIQSLDSLSDLSKMLTKHKMFNVVAANDQNINKRYGALDIHQVPKTRGQYVIRLVLSQNVPVSYAKIFTDIIKDINIPYIYEVMSIEKHINAVLEVYSKWENMRRTIHQIGLEEDKIIGKHTGNKINSLVNSMDHNIDVQMAVHDMADLDAALCAFDASKKYMEENGLKDTLECREIYERIEETKDQIEDIKELLAEPDLMQSIYFRLTSPPHLSKYRIETVNIIKRGETWGKVS
jgi:hypothetical protein